MCTAAINSSALWLPPVMLHCGAASPSVTGILYIECAIVPPSLFKATSRRDLMQTTAHCGGQVFICCDDFRQIPPVIPGGGRKAIFEATIKSFPLWASFQQRELTHPQRDAGYTAYSNFVDLIGGVRLPATHATTTVVELVCLEPLAVSTNEGEAISFMFPDISDVQQCSQRVIITGTNRVVNALNRKILTMLHGEEFSLFGVTRL